MPNLNAAGILASTKLEGDIWAFLFTVYLDYGGSTATLYFTNFNDDILFNGNVYQRLPMRLGTMSTSKDGKLQNFSIQLDNTSGVMQSILMQYNGLRKQRVDIQVINVDNPDAYALPESFRVENAAFSAGICELTLGPTEDVLMIKLPKRIFTKADFPYLTAAAK